MKMAELEKSNLEEMDKDLIVDEPEDGENTWNISPYTDDESVWKISSTLDEEDLKYIPDFDWDEDEEEDDDDDREEIDYYDEEINESLKNTPFGDLSTNREKK